MAAVYRCTGQTYDTDSLIHAVLHLEQVFTTGEAVGADNPAAFGRFTRLPLLPQVEAGRTRWGV